MQQIPKISIITPNYNQANFLEATIQSVLSQNYPNLEYIIIDGGSTDGSVEVIKKYESQLAYWVSEKDNGQYHAIQKGFEKSTGEIMAYINSDDIFRKKSFYIVAEIFSNYSYVQWLNGAPNEIDEEDRLIYVGNIKHWNKYSYLQKNYSFIQQEGVFWRRGLWEETGSYISTEYSLASDLELWSRFFQKTNLFYVTAPLASFRVRSSNQRSLEGMDEYKKEADIILTKMPRTKREANILRLRKFWVYRLLRKSLFSFIFKALQFHKIEEEINKYPHYFSFDRINKKFIPPKR